MRSRRLELPRFAPQAPQACASTNSAMTARNSGIIGYFSPKGKNKVYCGVQIIVAFRADFVYTGAHRPYHLAVRIRPSQGRYAGSIPARVANKKSAFTVDFFIGWSNYLNYYNPLSLRFIIISDISMFLGTSSNDKSILATSLRFIHASGPSITY